MSIVLLIIANVFTGYHIGRIRLKYQMKTAAYFKHFDINHTYVGDRITTLTERELGFCDGMTYIVESVTGERIAYWGG